MTPARTTPLKVLVACEFSGIVRDAFTARGHHAVSVDLLPTERPGPHLIADVRRLLGWGWDMMIGFPPCTALCSSGNRWYAGTPERAAAVEFFKLLAEAPIPRIALENPAMGALTSMYRRPDMILHPWEYGHPELKKTGIWLRGLPPLMVTDWIAGPYHARVLRAPDSRDRWKNRSRTLPGIAKAMADEWG